ncbi:MAG: aminotransferase class I/II-fold pyridoxal phosphate-dependent enzyme [Bacteroidia bacterium]|nr:aminotransferase class I/II-fold pyridoxal phosphate-dependent enzyme [Bacteroidia bacterium]MCC7532540.1 aminotransferase class I/II-fold pyridoxal phosphate-dependent enzyme [Bacteroidia bacterium]
MDIFEKLKKKAGPLGQHADDAYGYYMFPKLEGPLGPRMMFRGRMVLNWSLNNYLGLANHPEVRKADAEAAEEFGLAYPMGARMMSGNSVFHEQLDRELAEFVNKEDAVLLNYGYQGMVSAIDALVDRHDVIVYDAESHACIVDGVRLHMGKRFLYKHNDIASLEQQLVRAKKITDETGGGILVITEGVFGMTGAQGKIAEIVELKKKFDFRLFVDDAHGFGSIGTGGRGVGFEQNCNDGIDIYFGTFAKSMALIGGFIAAKKDVVKFLRYNLRSQIYAKSVPMPMVKGALKRLDLIRKHPEYKEKLWTIVRALQGGLKEKGFDIGHTNTMVTPVMLKGSVGEATGVVYDLREKFNIFCSVVVYPVIPKGMILLRLIPTASHSIEDVNETIAAFSAIKDKLESGAYQMDKGIVAMGENL